MGVDPISIAAMGALASAAPALFSSVAPSTLAAIGMPGLGALFSGAGGAASIGDVMSAAGAQGLAPAMSLAPGAAANATWSAVTPSMGTALSTAGPQFGKDLISGTGSNLLKNLMSQQSGKPSPDRIQPPQAPQAASMAPPIQFGNANRQLGQMNPEDLMRYLFGGAGSGQGMLQ